MENKNAMKFLEFHKFINDVYHEKVVQDKNPDYENRVITLRIQEGEETTERICRNVKFTFDEDNGNMTYTETKLTRFDNTFETFYYFHLQVNHTTEILDYEEYEDSPIFFKIEGSLYALTKAEIVYPKWYNGENDVKGDVYFTVVKV